MERSAEIHTCIVCHSLDCELRGSVPVGKEIARRLAEAGSSARVTPHLCFGACDDGPNIVLYPLGTWYKGCQLDDAEAITAHVLGGAPVEHLAEQIDPDLRDCILAMLDAGLG